MNNSQKNKFLSKTELSKLRENHKNKKIILCHGVLMFYTMVYTSS